MPYVMNCLESQVSVQAFGKWFTFKPREIKMFYVPEIARFMGQAKGEEGLVEIPDSIMEQDAAAPERVEYLAEKLKEGVHKRINKLEWQKHNLLASLRLDLEVKGMKVDPLVLASKGDVAAIKELNVLKGEIAATELSNADILRKELGIDGTVNSTDAGKTSTGRSGPTESA